LQLLCSQDALALEYSRAYLRAAAHMSFANMGWLRSVGSMKLQVSFAEYSLFYRALLQLYTLMWAYSRAATHMSFANMGWLRSVGSIKLQVSFAEYGLFYKALLQKRPVILSILLT